MASKVRRRPKCSTCGQCCREHGFSLFMAPGDYRRWRRQERWDILQYVYLASPRGYGDLWLDPKTGGELGYCPFLKRVSPDRYICTIQDTKPKECKEFFCEGAYAIGQRGVPFKTESGWSEKARQSGYGKNRNGPQFLATKRRRTKKQRLAPKGILASKRGFGN